MNLDSIAWQELILEPEAVRAPKKNPSIQGMLSIGAVDVFDAVKLAELKEQPLDAEISDRLSTHVFKCLRIPLSVRHVDNVTLNLLIIEFALKTSGDGAISWSLDPLRVDQVMTVKTKSAFSANLGIEAVPIKFGATDEVNKEYVVRHPEMEAFGIRKDLSGWEFRPLLGRPYSGIQILSAVVRVPKGVNCTAVVRIRAEIEESKFIFVYKVRTADEAEEVAHVIVV